MQGTFPWQTFRPSLQETRAYGRPSSAAAKMRAPAAAQTPWRRAQRFTAPCSWPTCRPPWDLFRSYSAASSAAGFFEGVLVPVMREIGDRWAAGRLSIATEHLASNTARDLVAAAARTPAARGLPKVLVCSPVGEEHCLGCGVIEAVLQGRGFFVLNVSPGRLPRPFWNFWKGSGRPPYWSQLRFQTTCLRQGGWPPRSGPRAARLWWPGARRCGRARPDLRRPLPQTLPSPPCLK